jgi:NADH:ubiquinone oxidoreductase subunit E/NAD-dependent dihydropyrimidine dehydrogenase PreA subunit
MGEASTKPAGAPVGAVLVVGAGIAGIQASLDLAGSGYRVYLVERQPSIGGTMTQLDKTFPTNDCSMCIVSPKLVECARHPDIQTITYAEVEKVTGEAGRFTVEIRKKARSVVAAKCTGCGICQAACPTRATVRVPEPVEDEPSEECARVDAIIDSYQGGGRCSGPPEGRCSGPPGRQSGGPPERQWLIMILQDAQQAFNWLPESVLHRIATRLGVPYAEVYGAASFYKAFSLQPRGRHIVQVCMGTACHVRGAQRVLEELERRLDVGAGGTTGDGSFTLETVNCLGACALGPIVAVDGEFHGSMTTTRVPRLLERYAGVAPREAERATIEVAGRAASCGVPLDGSPATRRPGQGSTS